VRLKGPLVAGTFIRRDNRFRATVEVGGQPVWAHVPNSGRLGELLVSGHPVLLRQADLPHRKTKYDLALVELDRGLVSVDARLPNKLVHEAIAAGQMPEFIGYETIRREVAYGASRLDFVLEDDERRCFIEVKSVTLVCDGVALFPDAPTQRGRRHVGELAQAVQEGERAAVVFAVQREDATMFAPNDGADPAFGQALREAARAGVEVYAYRCRVSRNEVVLDRPIPVALQASLDGMARSRGG
jgi:sugar fermentation stimulation protein A